MLQCRAEWESGKTANGGSLEEAKRAVVSSMEARRKEIEAACRERIASIGNDRRVSDVEYVEGLRASIPKAFEYGLAGIADGRRAPQVPALLLTQARLAARNGAGLAVVQRRYMDCFHIFTGSLAEELERHGAIGTGLHRHLREATKALFDRLIDAVEDEHGRERKRPSSPEPQRFELVKAYLAGERIDAPELGYEFNYFHVGLVARGTGAANAIKGLASGLDCLPLVVRLDDRAAWGWLGKRQEIEMRDLQQFVCSRWPGDTPLGIGEIGQGEEGWRRTHRQAEEAFRLAPRVPGRIFRYGEDPLLPSISRDEDLVAHLRETFIVPLEDDSSRAPRLETLRAYIAAHRNGASAANALGAQRQTVSNHLKWIEAKLGCRLEDRIAEIEVALRLERLDEDRGGRGRRLPSSFCAWLGRLPLRDWPDEGNSKGDHIIDHLTLIVLNSIRAKLSQSHQGARA